MSDMLDYVVWRGDLGFAVSDFCEIDALIFCQISYLAFSGIVPPQSGGTITLKEAAAVFFADKSRYSQLGIHINKKTIELFKLMAVSERYKDVLMFGYTEFADSRSVYQFAALSFAFGEGRVFIAYRGTDDSIVGWKEDCMMAYLPVIPSQRLSLEYCSSIARSRSVKKLITGGHSKGGNLAVYASALCCTAIRKKLIRVYNFDGPGFTGARLDEPEFVSLMPLVRSYTPELSVIGMFFKPVGTMTVVASCEKGIMQHDLFSWQLEGPLLRRVPETSSKSRFIDRSFKQLLEGLNEAERRMIVEFIFQVIENGHSQTLTELKNNGLETFFSLMGALGKTDAKTRDALMHSAAGILKIALPH